MRFGLNFFPSFRPQDSTTADYYQQYLRIAEPADVLGYSSIKTVEHSFYDYGGHSPSRAEAAYAGLDRGDLDRGIFSLRGAQRLQPHDRALRREAGPAAGACQAIPQGMGRVGPQAGRRAGAGGAVRLCRREARRGA